jgi:hypothetical protein
MAKCDNPSCAKSGILGDTIRTYVVTSPLAVFDTRLCFKCFDKQREKNKRQKRKHIHIEDKVHV